MKNIAIIGSGGREHAISWKLQQSNLVNQVFAIPGNGGIPNSIPADISNFSEIEKICKEKQIKTLFIGPEVPLANGITDYFLARDISVFGPDKNASQLECSKIFAKKFMQKYEVATADFEEFNSVNVASAYLKKLNWNAVIKYDGLAGGKGVFVCENENDCKIALQKMTKKYGKSIRFLIEEKLSGKELSIIGITDGRTIKTLSPSQDHKQLSEGDRGPNTGGMGAFCPVSFLNEALMQSIDEKIIKPTLRGIQNEKFHYIGAIYFGLMITPDGPKVLEYNVRFGDPETEVIIPALDNDLMEIMEACFTRNLDSIDFTFSSDSYVDVVLISDGYPETYETGFLISGLDGVQNSLIFHAGTKQINEQFFTNGGRVLNIVTHASTLKKAINHAYDAVDKIHFKNKKYRKDIGMRDNI